MRELQTEITIAAPISTVWEILIDVQNWQQWNPISTATGTVTTGSTLSITMLGDNGKAGMKYPATVTKLDAFKSFHWRATMMAGFLFTNNKIFELEEIESGTHLIHKEQFSGMMVPLFWSKLNSGCIPMFNSVNEALKKTAEQSTNN